MNSDEVKGKAETLKGKVKQGVGRATDDPELRDEGAVDEAAGRTRETFGVHDAKWARRSRMLAMR